MNATTENNENREQFLQKALQECDIKVEKETLPAILHYHDMLTEKNKVINLTAITDFEESVWKHYADSLALLKFDDLKNCRTLLDVGSGAGLPGIPLKITCPWLSVTLLDAVGKKVNFHHEVIDELHLDHITSVHMRSEDAAHQSTFREKFDFVVARAVSNLTTLSEYCLPFVKQGGIFAAYKSEMVEQELKDAETALKILGGSVLSLNQYSIDQYARSLIMIKKTGPTPKRYPRKAGTPLKEPIR